ncbi:MAG TPA: FAD/NAD(P)-binding protein [Candidatus Kapabacteria bacterium]|jgi:NAD(P)H-flavin reductase|nr:FAD/NAD(P)-binding protein [Candidatus Kapabacteria bacterium]HVK37717.1 FAD/NAD(P)-binding protein [Candidatus Kapabacteria bacterium]
MESLLEVPVAEHDIGTDPMLPRPFEVRRARHETHDTFTLTLEALDGGPELRFRPGQFNMLYLFGVGEVPISISGNPGTPQSLVHTTRAVGTVTRAMAKLKVGDVVGVRGPYGRPWPVGDCEGSDLVLVAGGIGLAPLRPAIYEVLARRERYGKVVLLYGTRSPADLLFRAELESWRARFDLDVFVTVDRGMEGWRGSVGVVTTLIRRAPFDPQNAVAFVCGPEVMMRYTVEELRKRGIDNDRMYLSMERNMKCGIGLCGHCQYGPTFVCKDGPVYRYDALVDLFVKREV